MKMDAQGFEMHVLGGARRLLQAGCIGTIRFEVADKWLEGQGTSAKQLLNTMHEHGFELYDGVGSGAKIAPHMYGKHRYGIYDLTARLENMPSR